VTVTGDCQARMGFGLGIGMGRGRGKFSGKKCRLVSMFSLTTAFFFVEIIVGYLTNSMALVADSFHMLSDIAALVIAFISVRMAPKSWSKNTFGWARAEVLGALVNAVFLVALCFSITVESLKRFYEPEVIHDPQLILWVGTMGLVVNLVGLCLFHEHGSSHGHGHGISRSTHSHLTDLADKDPEKDGIPAISFSGGEKSDSHGHSHGGGHGHAHGGGGDSASNMNMRGVFLHVMADALGSVIVIISALIMWFVKGQEWTKYVDPGLSLLLVLLILRSVWPLLIESALILLQTVPTHIQVDSLQQKLMEKVDGILAVHEFHIWQLAGDRIIASAHVRCLNLAQYMTVAERVKEFFHNEGIHSTTIQPEFVETAEPTGSISSTEDCMLSCPKTKPTDQGCDASKCCPPAMGSKVGSSSQFPVTRSGQSSPSDTRHRRPSSISISGVAVTGLGSTPSRRSAPDLALLTDEMEILSEAKHPSILKTRKKSDQSPPPPPPTTAPPPPTGTGSPARSIFDPPGDLPSLEGSESGENTPMVAKNRLGWVVTKQSNV
jgi:cation diffusion facilitator family transporter